MARFGCRRYRPGSAGVAVLFGAASACANVSTLQTARPLATGRTEHSVQAWMLPTNESSVLGADIHRAALPAYSYREGLERGDWGVRLTAPGSLQFDLKESSVGSRFAGSLGLGVGTDVASLIGLVLTAAANSDDESSNGSSKDDGYTPLTFELFLPVIASFELVPEYLSVHATLRPGLWVYTPADEVDRHVQFSGVGAGGIRAGRDFGVHAEAAPLWTTGYGFGWSAAASVFYRPGE